MAHIEPSLFKETEAMPGTSQKEKAKQFYDLHHSKDILILPNIWDPLGAKLLEDVGYAAVATASAAIAFSNGYDDGENIPFEDVLRILKKIVDSVNIPITADIESGFAETDGELKKHIQQLLETGIAGINFEDSDKKTNELLPVEMQCQRIQVIKKAAQEMNTSIFINARTDVYIRGKGFETPASKLEETIKRGKAYKSAGADCFFPITVRDEKEIKNIVEQVRMPINILLIPGVPGLDILHKMGVRRISLGPGFLKFAIKAMKNLAMKLQKNEGLTDITGNEITSDYLKGLVNKNK